MSTARAQDEVAEVIREICLVMDCCNTDLAEIRRGAAIVLVATDIGRKNWSLEIQRKFAAVPLCYPCKLTKVPIVDRGRCPLLRSPPPGVRSRVIAMVNAERELFLPRPHPVTAPGCLQ